MAKTERYRLARPDMQLPMPDRGGRLFTTDVEGEAVDVEDRFWANLIADGDLVPVSRVASPATPADPPTGRRTTGGSRSRPRPAAE